ncbi:MAG: Histidine decarboxylase [Planctomycetes bacterium]|nr:Histidine decarboxylase [Planctomycetota bacterium]
MNDFAGEIARAVAAGPVSRPVSMEALRRRLDRFDFDAPVDASDVLREIRSLFEDGLVQVTHPRYFGLFNPSVVPAAAGAAALVAAFNPQIAVWSHAPAAAEMERRVLRVLLAAVGWNPDASAAHATSGGAEANTTAVVCALAAAFPAWRDGGLRALPAQPALYVSEEAHHSFEKAALVTGLGRGAVRVVATDAAFRMRPDALAVRIAEDRRAGLVPFLVVATAGATASGAVDPVRELAAVAAREGAWLHADGAWGASWLLSTTRRHVLDGIGLADSVTWDAHKALSVPMGCGVFLTRRPDVPRRAFDVAGPYMPPPREGADDPFRTTMQWSRRAAAVPLFAAMASLGRAGVASMLDRMAALGDALRERLAASGFRTVNSTALPLVCVTHPAMEGERRHAGRVASIVQKRGRAWVSPVTLPGGVRAVRACITSFLTTEADLDVLAAELREAVEGGSSHE